MPLPTMTPVESSNVSAVGHDGQHLYVSYKSGGTYKYADVPTDKHTEMLACKSVGGYVHANIKGKHDMSKVDDVVVVVE